MARAVISLLAPDPLLLGVAVAIDLGLGDPVYSAHPIRVLGWTLSWVEGRLRVLGWDGYGGGILLFAALATTALLVTIGLAAAAVAVAPAAAWLLHLFLLYSLLALGDLVHHVWRIDAAVRANDLDRARSAVRALVGRDTDRMDGAACRRAAVESLSENLTDGFVSPVFWYAAAGLPGIVAFKVVSTMDSMVGYKTPRYLRFGWCGARLDDLMNYLPARLTWLIVVGVAACLPGYSGQKAWIVGWRQHAVLLGPNSGWSEAATAGALQRRIVGPIWLNGVLVTDSWVGDGADAPLASSADVWRAVVLVVVAALVAAGLACTFIWLHL